MKKIILIIVSFNLFFLSANAVEKKDCSVHKKILDKIKCKAENLKKNSFIKDTIDYQKKSFNKKDKN
jgi:hypothetical protein